MSSKQLAVSSGPLRHGFLFLSVCIIAGCLLLIANRVQAQECELDREVGGVTIRRAIEAQGGTPSEYSCRRVPGGISTVRSSCVSGGCPSYPSSEVLCCAPGIGSAPGTAPSEPAGGGTDAGAGPRPSAGLVLPDCVSDGSCTLDDIVRTGVNFANFLFGISGAIFLAIFIYSGVEYLIFAQNASKVQAAKRRLVDAAIGVGFIIAAGALVTFVYEGFLRAGGSGPSEDMCSTHNSGFSCVVLPGSGAELDAEIERRGCRRGFCTGGTNRVCCPAETSGSSSPPAECASYDCVGARAFCGTAEQRTRNPEGCREYIPCCGGG